MIFDVQAKAYIPDPNNREPDGTPLPLREEWRSLKGAIGLTYAAAKRRLRGFQRKHPTLEISHPAQPVT